MSRAVFVLNTMYSQLRSYQGAIIDFRPDNVVGDDATKNMTANTQANKLLALLDPLSADVHLGTTTAIPKPHDGHTNKHDGLRPHKVTVDAYPSSHMQPPPQYWDKPPQSDMGGYHPQPQSMDHATAASGQQQRPKAKQHLHSIHPQLIEAQHPQFADAVTMLAPPQNVMMHSDPSPPPTNTTTNTTTTNNKGKRDPHSHPPHPAPLPPPPASESPSMTVAGAMATPAPMSPSPKHHGPRKPGGDVKRKRGRPKKIILDPSTNTYIDLSHPNFKQLNKQLKPMAHQYRLDDGTTQLTSATNAVLRSYDQNEVQLLLQKKDRRGRPRKFPIEETGLTIKGVRINGAKKRKHLDMSPPRPT